MKHTILAVLAAASLWAAPAAAQNREHVEIFADMRMLQEQVQKLQLAVNQLTEQLNATNARLDRQSGDAVKAAADQKLVIDGLQNSMREMSERLSESAVGVSRVNSEIKVLREALTLQQTLLNQILNLLQTNLGAAAPGGGGGAATPATPPSGGQSLPPSPSEYWNAAWSYYASSKYPEAIAAFDEYLRQFPTSPDAAKAQMFIGDAHFSLGKFKDALTAYGVVISKYPNAEQVPEAYLKQGQSYATLKQNAEAKRIYDLVINRYPKSDAAVFAKEFLKSIK